MYFGIHLWYSLRNSRDKAPSTVRRSNLKRSFIHSLGYHPHYSVAKTELFEKALQTGGIWKRRFCVLAWAENKLKTELFEIDNITIIEWFLCPSFPRIQIQTVTDESTVAFSNVSGEVFSENVWCVFRVKLSFTNPSGDRWINGCVFNFFPGVVFLENIWCVFRVKISFSIFFSVVWTELNAALLQNGFVLRFYS